MKAVLDIRYVDDRGFGDMALGRYAYGVFVMQDSDENVFIAVKNKDKIDKIQLEDENKTLIQRIFDESVERESREKKMKEFEDLILCVSKKTEKIEEFLKFEKGEAIKTLDRIVGKYIRDTWVRVVEMKKQKDEVKEKEPLPEDSFKGFISEAALERIIREIVSKKED